MNGLACVPPTALVSSLSGAHRPIFQNFDCIANAQTQESVSPWTGPDHAQHLAHDPQHHHQQPLPQQHQHQHAGYMHTWPQIPSLPHANSSFAPYSGGAYNDNSGNGAESTPVASLPPLSSLTGENSILGAGLGNGLGGQGDVGSQYFEGTHRHHLNSYGNVASSSSTPAVSSTLPPPSQLFPSSLSGGGSGMAYEYSQNQHEHIVDNRGDRMYPNTFDSFAAPLPSSTHRFNSLTSQQQQQQLPSSSSETLFSNSNQSTAPAATAGGRGGKGRSSNGLSNGSTGGGGGNSGGRVSGNPPAGVTHCAFCGTTSSPEWRKGVTGIKNLCNA